MNDCGDGSDELSCNYETCGSNQFTCGNGACIFASYICDGESDCLDGSDEADSLCVTPQPTCAPQEYMCKSGECIDINKVCNGMKDCPDNSDEKGCGEILKYETKGLLPNQLGILRRFTIIKFMSSSVKQNISSDV